MPHDEADPEDPMELMGLVLPASEEELAEAARCFIEEFAWLGYDRARILRLFTDSNYRGVHGIYEQKGEAWCRALIDQVAAELANTHASAGEAAPGEDHCECACHHDEEPAAAPRRLPVIQG